MRAVVVGGGLAGLAAALDLVDAGADVTLLEARPTLGGAVQTLPEREGDPQPPPDNGQHIALGCFTEYLRFLDRIGESGSVLRQAARAAGDRRGRRRSPRSARARRRCSATATCRSRDRLAPAARARATARARRRATDETFGALLRRLGASDAAIDRFWDVFIRPALNLRTRRGERRGGPLHRPHRAARPARERRSDPAARGRSARCTATRPAACSRRPERRCGRTRALLHRDNVATLSDGAELDADAIVVAVPPARERAPARRARAGARGLADRQRPPLFDRPLLRSPLAALLASDAHWVFDRGALTGHEPERGQYLTVVSSGVPELLEIRGRELVERIAGQLTERLGPAELLWSRVSREPYATVALRPGVARPGAATGRPGVVRAGAWTDTGWPATMESAVRSGRAAAAYALADDGDGGGMTATAELTRARRGDRPRHAPPARAAAARRHLGRRARVERDDDRAAPLLEPLPRPAHAGARPRHRERAAWRGCATTARGRSGSRARPTSRRRSRRTSRCGCAASTPGRRARDYIRREGGIPKSRLFTKCFLALLGQWPWQRMVPIPPELVLLPPSSPFSIYNFACWARQTFVALSVAQSLRPVRPADVDLRDDRRDRPGRRGRRARPTPLRRRRYAVAEQWIRERQEADGSWGGIQPPWVWGIIALAALGHGFEDEHAAPRGRGLARLHGRGRRPPPPRGVPVAGLGHRRSRCSRCARAASRPTIRSSSAPASTSCARR